jgi:endonuclease YncB( thermonuclease family)
MSLGEVPHYTYQASVLEIVDGDTLWAEINLGFNISTTQKLRLRGINAPEIETPGGIASKQYIEDCLKGCPFIAIKTYWRDKYTRYLADIFYDDPKKDLLHVIQKGNFLNQELLDKGFAVKV